MLRSISGPLPLLRRRPSSLPTHSPTRRCRTSRLPSRLSCSARIRCVEVERSIPWVIRAMSTSSSSMSAKAPLLSNNGAAVNLLDAIQDSYDGVTINMEASMEPEAFVFCLRASIQEWRQQGKKGVWLRLPIEFSHLVNAAVKVGFWYHHAEPKYLMLVYWIPDTAHTLPVNATHRVGVGAFVMNDKREVLVVQEKSGRLKGTGIWKFPTGVVDQGEDICVGAIREVKEETGIDTEFVEVLAFRQSHKAFFEKSDLFFVCMLRPLSFDIHKQDLEIEAAQWMPIDEYADQEFVQKHELLKYIIDVGLAKMGKKYSGFSPVLLRSGFSVFENSYIYMNTTDLSK